MARVTRWGIEWERPPLSGECFSRHQKGAYDSLTPEERSAVFASGGRVDGEIRRRDAADRERALGRRLDGSPLTPSPGPSTQAQGGGPVG